MFRRYAGFLKKLISSRFGATAAIVFGLCLGIWFFGRMLRIGGNQPLAPVDRRLTLILIIISIYAIYLLISLVISWYKKRKSKPESVETFDPAAIEIKDLDESFHQLKTILKRNWNKKGSSSYIYALPWYLVIGLSGTGKTSLITRSGLKFPLAHLLNQDTIRDVEKTHSFDWWVTDDAVIIDTPGHFIAPEKGDTKEDIKVTKKVWGHFIHLLRKTRKRRPLNGVVITLDAKKLSDQTENERIDHAAQIHHRIAELIEKLGTRFSIYIALTRIDLLEGFEEIFQRLSVSEREDLMGFSFSIDTQDINVWKEELDQQFKDFIDRLNIKALNQLADINKTDARQKTWLFIRQMNGLRSVIKEFMDLALSGDRFSTPPMVRGLYMTSVKQENVPVDAWIDAVSDRYNIPRSVRSAHRGASKPWFVGRLFPDVIFKEAGLAGDNIKVEARRRIISWSCVLASMIAGIFISLGWWDSYKHNMDKIQDVETYTQSYQLASIAEDFDPTGANLLTEMETLRKATFSFEGYRERSLIGSGARLYQGKKFGPLADQAYLNLLGKGFLTELAMGVADDIGSMNNRFSDERLRALQVYLMLGDEDLREPTIVSNWFKPKWSVAYQQDENIQQKLNEHLDYALMHVKGDLVSLDDDLIKNTQVDLRSTPLADRIYNEIKELAAADLPNALNLRSEIGAGFDIIYQHDNIITDEDGIQRYIDSSYTIPRLFTKDSFHNYFIPRNNEISQIAAKYLYILGLKDKNIELSDADIEELKSQVRSLYVSDYIRIWNEALANLDIRNFSSMQEAGEVLETVNGVTEPLTRLVKTVVRETTLYDITEEKELRRQAAQLEKSKTQAEGSETPTDADLVRAADPYRIEGLRINRSFKAWADLLIAVNEEQPSYMEETYKSLDALSTYVRSINDMQTPGAEALRKANQRLKLEGDDPIYVVRRIASGVPPLLGRQIDKLATESWKVILDSSSLELERLWINHVLSEWNLKLAYRYPFNASSQDDVMLEDLSQFFGPKGTLNGFWRENLSSFIDATTSEPIIIDGHSLNISNNFIEGLKEARRISQLFFGLDGNLNVDFNLTPIEMSNSLNRSVLNIEGQLVSFNHSSTAPANMIWPNNVNNTPEARLDVFSRGGRNLSRSYKGTWAWYRLLKTGSLSDMRQNSANLTLDAGTAAASVTYKMKINRGSNILLRGSLDDFRLQPTFGKRSE